MIYGERIRFRAPEREDIPRFQTWLNDPEVSRGLSLYLPLSLADETNWFENMLKQAPEMHPFVIEIRQAEEWAPVGNCDFHGLDWRNRSAEVGIFLGEKTVWNQGYGTEVMQLLLKHGFQTLNLHRIYLRVFANNKGAIRAYEKAGFRHEGCHRDGYFQDGIYIDVLWMSVLRQEWLPELHK